MYYKNCEYEQKQATTHGYAKAVVAYVVPFFTQICKD